MKFSLVLAVLSLSATTSAQWPEWRGPSRDGVVPAAVVPKAWPEALKEGWAAEVGEGYSTPVVDGGRVFVHAHPVLVPGGVLVRDQTHLRLWTW